MSLSFCENWHFAAIYGSEVQQCRQASCREAWATRLLTVQFYSLYFRSIVGWVATFNHLLTTQYIFLNITRSRDRDVAFKWRMRLLFFFSVTVVDSFSLLTVVTVVLYLSKAYIFCCSCNHSGSIKTNFLIGWRILNFLKKTQYRTVTEIQVSVRGTGWIVLN
jgi:hypothetical protein